ncbi:MAG: efflux RND transporter periplasmic adaptor subunit [Pseudomonadota bacterium]
MHRSPSFFASALLALLVVGWLWSGQIDAEINQLTDETPSGDHEEPLFKVQVRDLTAEPVEIDLTVNGWTAPSRTVRVRGEADGRVIAIGPKEGDLVREGDVLLALDPRDHEVALAEAEAMLKQRAIELDAARRLGEKGFQAETKVAEATANHATAIAALKRAELDHERTAIKTPFTGLLDQLDVEVGDFVDTGEEVATIIDRDPFLVIGHVTETEVGKLRPGMAGTARLAGGDTISGKLRFIAGRAHEQTRTFRVELEVPGIKGLSAFGVSAELRLAVDQLMAHRAPPSVLTLDDRGVLGVKIVDADDRVVFKQVGIEKSDSDRVWLSGLPERVRLITLGQDFVRAGAKVEPVTAGGAEKGPLVSELIR